MPVGERNFESNNSWDDDSSFMRGNTRNAKRAHIKSKKFSTVQTDAVRSPSTPLDNVNVGLLRSYKKQGRDKHHRWGHKYQNTIDQNESSDESVHSPRSRSNSMVSAPNNFHTSPTKLTIQQIADALQAPSQTSTPLSKSAGRHHRRSSGSGGSNGSFTSHAMGSTTDHSTPHSLNRYQLQHSPYYRALFGSPAAANQQSLGGHTASPASDFVSASSQSHPATACSSSDEEGGYDDRLPVRMSSAVTTVEGSSEGDDSNLNFGRCVTPVTHKRLFAADNDQYDAHKGVDGAVMGARSEDLWPSLPQSAGQGSSTRRPNITFAPTSASRSPGRISGGNRKGFGSNTGKMLTPSSESRKWLRSDKFLNKILAAGPTPSGQKTLRSSLKTTPDGPSSALPIPPSSAVMSPRKLRFPEPNNVSVSPSSSFKMPSPLQLDGPFSPIKVLPFAAALTPDRHKSYFYGSNSTNDNLELDMSSISPLRSTTPSAATSFKQALTPGLLSSPSPLVQTHHHHISFARYLAMTAAEGGMTPLPMSRSTTADQLTGLSEERPPSSEFLLSCLTELDPQQVVRMLHDEYLAGPNKTHSSGGMAQLTHALRSMSTNLNLVAGNAVASPPRRPKMWDDPDTESDEEEATPAGVDLLTAFLGGSKAEAFHRETCRAGFSNHTAFFQSLLQRCSYYRTLTKDKPHPVDAAWFYSQVYPAYYQLQQDREQRIEYLTGPLILRGYISSTFFFQLTSSLSFEDDRVTSSRLAVLKAFYLQSGADFSSLDAEAAKPVSGGASTKSNRHEIRSPRLHILVAMESCAISRLTRCLESSQLSIASEIDTNYISKRGFLDGDVGGDTGRMHTALFTGCDIGALAKGADERPAYKTRDNDNNMLELLKFVVSCHASELSGAEAQATPQCEALLFSALRVFVNMFRSYGFKLGNSSELVEQMDLLNSLLETMQGLLLWAHVLSVVQHSQRCGQTSPKEKVVREVSEPLLNRVCRTLLSALNKHWTSHCNFAQDIAHTRAVEIVLATYTPLVPTPAVSSPPTKNGTILPFLGGSEVGCVARRCVRKVLNKISCAHFKVALQALQSLQNLSVLHKYVLPCFRPEKLIVVADRADVHLLRTNEVRGGSYRVGFSSELREQMLNAAVEALRVNRTHWHPVVLQNSSAALDGLFDRIQDLEDEEEDRRERGEDQRQSDDDAQWAVEAEQSAHSQQYDSSEYSSGSEEEGNYV